MFKIEKNVALPKHARTSKYPFADMDVGDSFAAPDATRTALYTAAHLWAKRDGAGKKFIVREEGKGARIWRTK